MRMIFSIILATLIILAIQERHKILILIQQCIRREAQAMESSSISTLDMELEKYRNYQIRFEKVAYAQYTWETDWGSSRIYLENKNRFGMRHSTKSMSKKAYNKHAYYETEEASLIDYAVWQNRLLRYHPEVVSDAMYIELLGNYGNVPFCRGCSYAEDPQYVSKIKARYNEIFTNNKGELGEKSYVH